MKPNNDSTLQHTLMRRFFLALVISVVFSLFLFRVQNWFSGKHGLFTSGGQEDFEMYLDPTIQMLKGNNPYRMVLNGELYYIPGNSPLFLVTIIPYSVFRRSVALMLWWATNVISAIGVIIIMEQKLLPGPPRISRLLCLLILFLALAPTSSAIQIGQTSIVTLFFGLLGLVLLSQNTLLAGVFLGLAFSKYSLSFLLIPYLLLDRHFRALVIAGIVQLSGILIVSWLAKSNPLDLTMDYLALVRQYTLSPTELNLHSRLAEMGVSTQTAFAISVVCLMITVVTIIRYMVTQSERTPAKDKAILLPFLFIGAIPFIYHRLYDGVALILLAVSWSYIIIEPLSLGISRQWPRQFASVSGILITTAFLYPRSVIESKPWLSNAGVIFTTFAVLLVWFFLMSIMLLPVNTNSDMQKS